MLSGGLVVPLFVGCVASLILDTVLPGRWSFESVIYKEISEARVSSSSDDARRTKFGEESQLRSRGYLLRREFLSAATQHDPVTSSHFLTLRNTGFPLSVRLWLLLSWPLF